MFPPFALCRIIVMIGSACATGGCYSSFTVAEFEIKKCIMILYGWFIVFLISIWLNDKVEQEYGVSKGPKCVQALKRCMTREDNIIEEVGES